jgi:23S rRNA (pseudouridine1915-N3)-methyltransferase
MKIKIVLVGELHEPYKSLVREFVKRISRFSKVELLELKENKNTEKKIENLKEKSKLILLDEKGAEFNTKDFAKFLSLEKLEGRNLAFIIGGANGHSESLKGKADILFSLSKLTFPHELAAVVFAEGLYRALSLEAGHPYHRA